MKLPINLVDDNWKTFFVSFVFAIILQNADVLAVIHKKSLVKSSASSPTKTNALSTKPTPGKGIPTRILSEIRSLDNQLLCFPKLLCTIYQDDSITQRHASLNATELGVAYIKLLKAVHYASPTATTTTTTPPKRRASIIQIFRIPVGTIQASYEARKDHHHNTHDDVSDDYPNHFRSPLVDADHEEDNGDNYSMELDNPTRDDDDDGDSENREFLKEKLEISEMMKELKAEDEEALAAENEASSRGSLASTLFSSFLPFMGSRSMKSGYNVDLTSKRVSLPRNRRKRVEQVITLDRRTTRETKFRSSDQLDVSKVLPDVVKILLFSLYRKRSDTFFARIHHYNITQCLVQCVANRMFGMIFDDYILVFLKDPFWKAVNLWRQFKNRAQCEEKYQTCPFEAWEIVRMLDLVKGQSKVLSAYLKITVDKVKPERVIQ